MRYLRILGCDGGWELFFISYKIIFYIFFINVVIIFNVYYNYCNNFFLCCF